MSTLVQSSATPKDTWDQNREFWILSLSGGGYRGLYSAAILRELESIAGQPLATKFDLIGGTSVGSILAAAISKEIPASSLPSLFLDEGKQIFGPNKWLGIFRSKGIFSSRYRSEALRKLLLRNEYLSNTTFSDLNHRLIVPTVNLSKGSPQFFKTQHAPKFKEDGKRLLVDAVLASSAAPTFFPVYKYENERYADGGLVANSPLMVAIHEAIYVLGVPPENIYAISIGTMGGNLTVTPKMRLDAGILGWRKNLVLLPMSAQEEMQTHMAKHILGNRLIKFDRPQWKEQADVIGLDASDELASEVLLGNAKRTIQEDFDSDLMDQWKNHVAAEPTFYNL